LLSILLQNILYEILFATNFVENIYEFYNFVGNNYNERITCQFRSFKKIVEKRLFLQIILTNLQENFRVI